MSSLYRIFLKNIKKKPHKLFIHSLNETFCGARCEKEINFLRKFIKKNKITTLGINYKNSVDWIFWYLAADSLNNQIVLIKNGTREDDLKRIKIHQNIILEDLSKDINENLIYSLLNVIDLDNKYIIITNFSQL